MAVKLKKYNEKRNFTKTKEPPGKKTKAGKELRFVVQHHIASRDHYDLRLEWQGTMLSWAVPKGPSFFSRDKRLAVKVEDHPLEYRNFEGTIPKGEYGGGTVMIWDEGYWEPYKDMNTGLKEGSLKFTLYGERLKGKWALVCMRGKGPEDKNWLLIKEKDELEGTVEDINEFDTSIRTSRTMEEIAGGSTKQAHKNPFSSASVQLAELVTEIPKGKDWLYEVKYDGYRILAYAESGKVTLISRGGKDYTPKFKPAAEALASWAENRAMVLDGEMIIPDKNGRSDFQALQQYIKHPTGKNLIYVVFDILALDGEDLREMPLIRRKEVLEKLLAGTPADIRYSGHVAGGGEKSFKAAKDANLEGIIGKKADSVYSGTRNGDWIKIKCEARQEFVIGGYTRSQKKGDKGISSLLLGFYKGEDFIYCGRASGMSEKVMAELEAKFEPIVRKTPPFTNPGSPRNGETVIWIRPKYAAEIRFAEWTDEGLLRQASFKGLREDKNIKDIKKEKAPAGDNPPENAKAPAKKPAQKKSTVKKADGLTVAGVNITSPEKIVFARRGTTKEEIVRYYEQVYAHMAPYLDKRILSTIRCPGGISDACFFKKHPGTGAKGIKIVPVTNDKGETDDYFYIEGLAGLIHEVQMNTLEFHTWGSKADDIEKPDMIVFDLDPDEGMDLKRVRQGVRDLKSLLDELSLVSYLKVSGGKGYHVVIPLTPKAGWEACKEFARNIAKTMEQKWPGRYTSNVRKEKRKNRIFIDWIRNGKGATSIAPYSLRARESGGVSAPISWSELNKIAPDAVTMEAALKRIKGKDPWNGFFAQKQSIK